MMKLRKTIFGSKSESEVFHSLHSRWSPKLNLYPQLPLASIIHLEPQDLTTKERQFFYKTSVDYTLCLADGCPILSVEFDGVGGGFSRDAVYIPAREVSVDPYRKLKMDLKLKLAKTISYPFIIISYEEVESLDEKDSLMILDGIIGQLLAHQEFERRFNEMLKESKVRVEELREPERHDYIQDLVIGVEVQAELETDPIAKKAAEYYLACSRLGVKSYTFKFLHDLTLPGTKCTKKDSDWEGLLSRAKAMEHTIKIGCRIVIKTPKLVVVHTVWIRNFGDRFYTHTIVRNIAEYLGFKRAYSLFANK